MKQVKCLLKRRSNFTQGKIYNAEPHATKGLGEYKQPADYRIKDEDGEYFTVARTEDKLLRGWQWI